jgi:hypothetical protein
VCHGQPNSIRQGEIWAASTGQLLWQLRRVTRQQGTRTTTYTTYMSANFNLLLLQRIYQTCTHSKAHLCALTHRGCIQAKGTNCEVLRHESPHCAWWIQLARLHSSTLAFLAKDAGFVRVRHDRVCIRQTRSGTTCIQAWPRVYDLERTTAMQMPRCRIKGSSLHADKPLYEGRAVAQRH